MWVQPPPTHSIKRKAMSDFIREKRYLIVKRKDLVEACRDLPESTISCFNTVLSAVNKIRKERGVEQIKAVVVEDDWPEYEIVWKMIEERMAAKNKKPDPDDVFMQNLCQLVTPGTSINPNDFIDALHDVIDARIEANSNTHYHY